MSLAQKHKAVTLLRLEPAAPVSSKALYHCAPKFINAFFKFDSLHPSLQFFSYVQTARTPNICLESSTLPLSSPCDMHSIHQLLVLVNNCGRMQFCLLD